MPYYCDYCNYLTNSNSNFINHKKPKKIFKK